jgi:DNA polymerase-3 subunit delta'
MIPASGEGADTSAPNVAPLVPLPWQATAVAGLLARRERWPHALLITGPQGIGKRVLAEWLARSLLCESPADGGAPCGGCASCRYAAAAQHPDLRIVEPIEIDGDEATPVEWIVVERIRALMHWAELTSHRGGAKAALIVPAERMNASAANALLKTLEEPPADTYFLLVSHQPGRLPATIVSRCQRVAAPRPTAAEGRDWLEAHGVSDAASVLAQAQGAPLAAAAIADGGYQRERTAWLTALATPASLSVVALGARLDAVPRDARRERLAAAIDWLAAWCADLARVQAGGAVVQNPDFAGPLATLSRAVAAVPLFRYHRTLLNQRALLAHPLQPRLVAEALLIDYRNLFG